MLVSRKDREIIRELAGRVAEIAALPAQQETIDLWKALNSLNPVRPMVMIDQIPWHEMDVNGELALQTEDELCRQIETVLRRRLYRWKHMPVDWAIDPIVDVPKVIHGTGFGIQVEEETAISDARNDVVGHYYLDQLQNEEDLEKIRYSQVRLDGEATAEAEAKAHQLLGGLLQVHMQGVLPHFAPWDQIVCWHGVENTLADLALRPDFMHAMIARVTDVHLALLDQLEEQGLLGWGQTRIHCTGAYTDELPAPNFDSERPRAKDLWTFAMAQIFVGVSPKTHQEFELDYAEEWFSRFGLVYYGCCEPLHEKIDIIRETPNVRKISMSPWVDQEVGAERIGGDFVFSRKPNPAFLATDTWQPETIEADLRETVACCRRHGCPLELILKDISTVRYEPQRLWEWAEIAMRVVRE